LAYVLGHALFIKREIQDIKEMGFLCLRQWTDRKMPVNLAMTHD
jgi:hypothetical protein